MRCAVTADLARYEREVDRNDAYDAAVNAEAERIYGDEELLHEVLHVAVAAQERYQRNGRTGPGIEVCGGEYPDAVQALAEVFRILEEAEIAGPPGDAMVRSQELLFVVEEAKNFVGKAVSAAAKLHVQEEASIAEQDQADIARGAA